MYIGLSLALLYRRTEELAVGVKADSLTSEFCDVLENVSVFHDDDKIRLRIGKQLDVRDRVTVYQQQICQSALLDHTELAGVGVTFPRQLQQLRVGSRRHDERFRGCVPADQAGEQLSLALRQRLGKYNVGAERRLDVVLLRKRVGSVHTGEHFREFGSLVGARRKRVSHFLRERLRAQPDTLL